jgi:hypothetical protein
MDRRDDPRTGFTRRRFLEAAAIAPLGFRRTATIQTDLLELGAREAVDRIRRAELKAETYAAELLKQYEAHKDLNVVTSIEEVRVLEAARLVDRAGARGGQRSLGEFHLHRQPGDTDDWQGRRVLKGAHGGDLFVSVTGQGNAA